MNFLEELEALRLKTPRLFNINIGSENSDYCTHSDKNKNCYLLFAANFNEDCYYGGIVLDCRDCTDCEYTQYSELCYECVDTDKSYNCNFSSYIRGGSDLEYCELCFNCKNCFGCVGLQSKEYYILNKPYSREEYGKKVAEIKAQMRKDGSYGKQLPTTYKFEDTAAAR